MRSSFSYLNGVGTHIINISDWFGFKLALRFLLEMFFVTSSSSFGSKKCVLLLFIPFTISSLTSTPLTIWPDSARMAAVGKPIYPKPNIVIFFYS